MKYTDFVRVITDRVKMGGKFAVSQVETKAYIQAIRDALYDVLLAGEEVALPGIFRAYIVDSPAREVRNPQTGGKMMIPDRKRVKLKASKVLTELLYNQEAGEADDDEE